MQGNPTERYARWGIIILLIIVIGWQQYQISNVKTINSPLLEKIESIENKINVLSNVKDSLRIVIDSTHVKIVTNEKHFQEKINTIIVQPDSFSESFTRQYLRNYATTHGYSITGSSEIDN